MKISGALKVLAGLVAAGVTAGAIGTLVVGGVTRNVFMIGAGSGTLIGEAGLAVLGGTVACCIKSFLRDKGHISMAQGYKQMYEQS